MAARRSERFDVMIEAAVPLLTLCAIETDAGGAATLPSTPVHAAVAGHFGQGRVVAFGPHPEESASCAVAGQAVLNALKWALREADVPLRAADAAAEPAVAEAPAAHGTDESPMEISAADESGPPPLHDESIPEAAVGEDGASASA